MTNLTKEEKKSQFDALISKGKSLFITRSYERPDFSYGLYDSIPTREYYSDVNHDDYPGWRINSLMTLKKFFGENSTYVKEFEKNCKASSTESHLRQGIGVLEAAKNDCEDDILIEEKPDLPQNADMSVNRQSVLRRLFSEFATSLSNSMTFNKIAKVFFESGIIDSPEKPYGVYSGSKSDYVLEKLLKAQNKDGFPEMLSTIQFDLCYLSGGPLINDESLVSLMKLLGYKQNQNDPDPSLIAPDILPQVVESQKIGKRMVLENLPSNVSELVNELNDNVERNNPNASALLIRKILTLSCFIALDKIGKSSLLEDKELNDTLSIVQKELKISQIVMAKVKSSKWIGDSANHSYKIKINESDVEVAITGLRIFLGEIF